ncbi:MAG: zinc-ribbon domain-containing protein [Clostridia bacterium]|nr:zinc-ribbon domain-containing protein [Clostridia bacterium]
MAFCPKCGTQIPEDTKFCPGCGAEVGAPAAPAAPAAAAPAAPTFTEEEIKAGQGWAILAYLSWACLFPMFLCKDNKYVRFNANQGLVLAIFSTIGYCIPFIGWILSIFCFVLTVMQLIAVCKKQTKVMPLLGKIKILK